jgi:phytol kinase
VLNPWLGMGLVLACLGGLMGGLRVYQVRFAPHPEWVRKLLHVGMGLLALSFPWLFAETWPALALAALSIAVLVLLRFLESRAKGLGGVIAAVGRDSLGEVYFPAAVALVFVLSRLGNHDRPERAALLYVIPILLLTLADAGAALIGVFYGRLRFATVDGQKSAEGSLAFFIVAFFCVHVPLLLRTETGRAETLLIALLLALLATMFEAVAWWGLDNLVLPLASLLLLKSYLQLGSGELLARLVIAAALSIFVLVYLRRTSLVGSALLGAVLIGYLSWAMGGWQWMIAPVTLFVSYDRLAPRQPSRDPRVHDVHGVVCVSSAGLVWLVLAQALGRPEFLFPYTISFAAHLAIVLVVRVKRARPLTPAPRLLLIGIFTAWLLFMVPFLLLQRSVLDAAFALKCTVAALLGVAVAALAFYGTQPGLDDCPTDTARWMRQAADAALGSAVGLVPLNLT